MYRIVNGMITSRHAPISKLSRPFVAKQIRKIMSPLRMLKTGHNFLLRAEFPSKRNQNPAVVPKIPQMIIMAINMGFGMIIGIP